MRRIAPPLLGLALLPAAALAQIVPTDDPGSDCVAARIFAERTPRNRKYDENYCSANRDLAAYERCLRNAAENTTVRFFTDRCNAPEEGAYVSFNGRTHGVWRESPEPHPYVNYAGTYRGDDVVVRIHPKEPIEIYLDGTDVVGAKYSVDVVIENGKDILRVAAIYDSQP